MIKRKIAAHYILTGTGDILKNGIISLTEDGVIAGLTTNQGLIEEESCLEFYSGVLVPGFINAHCHLELSHLKGVFPEKSGLPHFLKNVINHRNVDEKLILTEASKGDLQLWKNGIVAVGDISNNSSTFDLKSKSKIKYHTFIEALGFLPARAENAYSWAEQCLIDARRLGLTASIVPHAPYSVSKALFELIAKLAIEEDSILSIHNQESQEEDNLYQSGNGKIANHLINNLLLDISFFIPTGKKAIESIVSWLPSRNNLILVHNIFTEESDIQIITEKREISRTFFALCPNSNLYIENRFPDIQLFRQKKLKLCFGTDSLSSNRNLSVLDEMKTTQKFYPDISLNELITWATKNGAEALGMDAWAGSFEIGKKPGLNVLSGLDINNLLLLPHSRVERLI